MRKTIVPSVLLLAVFTVITGVFYPLAVTLAGRVLFPGRAGGSIVHSGGRAIGSNLIGQTFTSPRYFWGRPSATSPPYNAAASTGSNLGPMNPALAESIAVRVGRLRWADPENTQRVPVDMVTTSGSGLDPDITPAAAYYQVSRVARARSVQEDALRALVRKHIAPRQFGLLGEARVNVLELNLALDGLEESR